MAAPLILLAAALAFAGDPRADFLAGKGVTGKDSVSLQAVQVQGGDFNPFEEVAKAWSLSDQEKAKAYELYQPKNKPQGTSAQPTPQVTSQLNDQTMGRATDLAGRLKWDRQAGDMPNTGGGMPSNNGMAQTNGGAVTGRVAPDYKALGAQRAGPNTLKTIDVPKGSDMERIDQTFQATVARLNREGKRTDPPLLNNMKASLMPGAKNLRCYDQADELVSDLQKLNIGKKWTFNIRSYTGEKDHEKNGHWWVEAVSSDPKQPTIVMDPWKNEIKTIDVKTETVIKPYASYWMGYVLGGFAE